MTRKRSSFDDFMREVEQETRAAGLEAQADAEAIRDHFRLAAQVLRRRRELGLTQQQLAVRIGVHQSEISNIERGAASPGYRMLVKLADGLQSDFTLVPRTTPARRARSSSKTRSTSRRAARVGAFAHAVRAKKDR
jgi:transcriptional regulator with XRE-family HTH domain